MKQATLDLIKNINENTFIPANTKNELFELFQLDTVADLRKVSRNFMKLYELLEYFDAQTSNATKEKEGIVKFGTEIGNAIDAETWKQAIGQTFGGYVSKVENKEAGKWYINDLTDGKIYKCIQSHRSTSFDITKFIDITNIGLSDKLENLSELVKVVDLGLHDLNTPDSRYISVGLPSLQNYKYVSFSIAPGANLTNVSYYHNITANAICLKANALGKARIYATFVKNI